MVEPIIYCAIGFLLACLMWLIFIPLVHKRAVRLTTRRVQAAAPSVAEIIVQKDLLRAEFAAAARRLEQAVEQMKVTIVSQRVELGLKREMIVKLKRQLFGETDEAEALSGYEDAVLVQPGIADELTHLQPAFGDPVIPLGAKDEIDSLPDVAAPTIAPVSGASAVQALPPAVWADDGRSLSDRIRALNHFRTVADVVGKTLNQIYKSARRAVEALGSLRLRLAPGGGGKNINAIKDADAAPAGAVPELAGSLSRSLSEHLRALQHVRTLPKAIEKTIGQIYGTARSGVEAVGAMQFHFGSQDEAGDKQSDRGLSSRDAKAEPIAPAATESEADRNRPVSSLERALQICKASNVLDQRASETIQRSLGILGELKRSA